MEDLLAALAREPGQVRRWVTVVAIVAGTIAAGVGAWHVQEAARVADCQAQGDAIDAVWGPTVSAAVADQLAAVDAVRGVQAFDRIAPVLGAFADQWRVQRTAACLDQVVGPRHRSTLACLDERKTELEAVVDVLSQADEAMLVRAVPAAASTSRA